MGVCLRCYFEHRSHENYIRAIDPENEKASLVVHGGYRHRAEYDSDREFVEGAGSEKGERSFAHRCWKEGVRVCIIDINWVVVDGVEVENSSFRRC